MEHEREWAIGHSLKSLPHKMHAGDSTGPIYIVFAETSSGMVIEFAVEYPSDFPNSPAVIRTEGFVIRRLVDPDPNYYGNTLGQELAFAGICIIYLNAHTGAWSYAKQTIEVQRDTVATEHLC
jgi:hypothetical protein